MRGAVTDPGASAAKIGSRSPHDVDLAADHHAVAALESPDAAAGPNVDIMDLLGLQLGGPADVIVIVRVAAVNQDVTRLEPADKLRDRRVDDRRGTISQIARGGFSLATNSSRLAPPDGPFLDKRIRRSAMNVVNHAFLPVRKAAAPCWSPFDPDRSCQAAWLPRD